MTSTNDAHSRALNAGVGIILFFTLIAIFAPLLSTHDPGSMDLENRFASPSLEHFFGLDQNGGDVFSQILYGARISLFVAFIVVTINGLAGLLIGSISGYLGGWVDLIVMRFVDMVYAFPGFLLTLALVAVLGPSIPNLIIAFTLTGWTSFARLIRGEFLHLKNREYVQGAIAIGASPLRIVTLHIWPNLAGLLVVQASFSMAGTIVTESGLSFLGLGAPPDIPTWGSILNAGRRSLIEAPHLSVFPGLAILLLVLAFNLLGDGLRGILDPKVRR